MKLHYVLGFNWKYNERIISQYIAIQWKNIAIRFSCIVTPILVTKSGHRKVATAKLSGFSSTFFHFSTVYTPLPHDLIKAKVLSLVNLCFNKEWKKKRTSVLQTKRASLATRSITRIKVGLALTYVKLLLSSCKKDMCNLKAWFINK